LTSAERNWLLSLSNTTESDGQLRAIDYLLAQAEKQYDETLFEDAKTDMAAFAEYVDPEWVAAPHHQLMINKLHEHLIDGENGRLIVSMPVGHGKSVYSSLSAPAFIFGQDPHQRIIAAGHTQKFVETAISRKVRDIINSERYQKLFPETTISASSRASDYFTINPQRPGTPGHYLAKGAGGGIAGFRATRIIADDLYPNLQEANSKTYRDNVKDWWTGDLTTRLLPGGNICLVVTRWHGDDLIGNLLDSMKDGGERWDTVILPALCDDPDNDPLGRQEGEALWPDFHTAEAMLLKKANSPARIWNSLYQCNPTATEGGILKEDWFVHWEQLPPDNMVKRRFTSFDCANTANSRSDYTVGTSWIETLDRRYFLVDAVRARVEFTELIKIINEFSTRANASAILIEDAGNGKSVLQAYQGKMCAPLIGINPYNRSKEMRFDEVSPMFEAGTVLLPKRHELLPDIERELLEFPNGSKDDIVDSCTHALRWARGSAVKRGTRKLGGTF
jgi:predicted phage terminase large subunit-like protein